MSGGIEQFLASGLGLRVSGVGFSRVRESSKHALNPKPRSNEVGSLQHPSTQRPRDFGPSLFGQKLIAAQPVNPKSLNPKSLNPKL